MEVSHDEDEEYKEERRILDGKRVEGGGCILWTNSEAIESRMKDNDKGTVAQNINDGVREQIKRREWEEDCENWIGYVDNNGDYWDEVSGAKHRGRGSHAS